ncbi:MAG: bifunctional (p)ppGpp synthetase/guanosine-3',5'-bis(diphosphate) 3'-pyrophosphohydrolase [Nitrospirota bacterium]|nr:MAG: bifunctional (p)ppGpp synthetase/guanosine-3',5'-bis(diphosphate) 3'-pyrophosphohydrolase [Nitrospirota bacterium]
MPTVEELKEKILIYEPDADVSLLRKAYYFSHEAHCSQRRIEGSPYIGHPLAVASTLADMHMDHKAIIAGLLHDTVEDTETRIDDIRDIFGEEVAFLVEGLTKLSKMESRSGKETQAENFRKMFLAMAEDIRVIIIKFADRLHNMKTLEYLSSAKQKRIAKETLDIYAPLANRLGIGWLKSAFEDLGFRYMLPDVYKDIEAKVAKKKEELEEYMDEVAAIVKKKIKKEHIRASVKWRVKHYYGIYQKMVAQRILFDQVHDVLGIRIIAESKSNCYAILGIIHSLWTPIPGQFKDYIAMPKSNLYQSLHTTVIGPRGSRVEFQIRTEEMNMVAEEGIASHWVYKEKGKIKERDTKYIAWLRELVQSQQTLSDASDFVEEIKGEVTPEVVYVITPQGDIRELKKGSTPVDFAYAIHSEVGHHCVGAKANGRIVPLRYELKNGDTVEIITSVSHGPSKDWLNFAVTSRARNRIKQWIKKEERKQSMALGARLLETELKKNDIPLSKLKQKSIKKVLESFSLGSLEDLHVSIGFGKVSPHQVANRLMPPKERDIEEDIAGRTKAVKERKEFKGINIKGIDNILYTVGKCCYPVPGDDLIGFVTRGKGVTIHRKNCPNLKRITMHDDRVIDVDWTPSENETTSVKLLVETVDKPGILANLSALISAEEINISHLEVNTSPDKKANFTFTLQVKDRDQLSKLSSKISGSSGVLHIKR